GEGHPSLRRVVRWSAGRPSGRGRRAPPAGPAPGAPRGPRRAPRPPPPRPPRAGRRAAPPPPRAAGPRPGVPPRRPERPAGARVEPGLQRDALLERAHLRVAELRDAVGDLHRGERAPDDAPLDGELALDEARDPVAIDARVMDLEPPGHVGDGRLRRVAQLDV